MNFVDQYRRMPVGQVGNLALGPVPMPPACSTSIVVSSPNLIRVSPLTCVSIQPLAPAFRKTFIAFLPPTSFTISFSSERDLSKIRRHLSSFYWGLFKRQKHSLNAPRGHGNTRIRGTIIIGAQCRHRERSLCHMEKPHCRRHRAAHRFPPVRRSTHRLV